MDIDSDGEKPLLVGKSPEGQQFQHFSSKDKNLYLASGAMLFGSLSVGVTLGMSSPMIPSMQKDDTIEMTESDFSWFGSLLSLGAMFGGLIGGLMMQRFGRKLSAILCGLPFTGGMVMMSYARSIPVLLTGRLLTGITVGIAILVTSTYLSETSTEHLRGFLGSLGQLTISIGILIAYVCGDFLHWRWLALICAMPCILWTFLARYIPETPRYLLIKHRRMDAKKALIFLRGESADVESEMIIIEKNIHKTSDSASWRDILLRKPIRTPVLLSLGISFFRQFSGQPCILFYSKTIFENAGLGSENYQNTGIIALAAVQVIFTIIPCFIVDKVGRKILLVSSGFLLAISTTMYGIYLQIIYRYLSSSDSDVNITTEFDNLDFLAVGSLMVFMAGFSIGFGPIFWLLVSELVPIRARGKGSAIVSCFNWFIGFVLTKEFYQMQETFTSQGTFWIFSVISFIGIMFHWILLPETKGKTLEEISMHFEETETT